MYPAKQQKLCRFAYYYLKKNPLLEVAIMFDGLRIMRAEDGPRLEDIHNAF